MVPATLSDLARKLAEGVVGEVGEVWSKTPSKQFLLSAFPRQVLNLSQQRIGEIMVKF